MSRDAEAPIAGGSIPEQEEIRPMRPVRSVDEFLGFLAEVEELFGPIEKPPGGIGGDRFLL